MIREDVEPLVLPDDSLSARVRTCASELKSAR